MFINLTPHVLNVKQDDGSFLAIPPSGMVARVEVKKTRLFVQDGVVFYGTQKGVIQDLPAAQDNVPMDKVYITSLIVAQVALRPDVVSPGTLIRNAEGQPVGCDGLDTQV